MPALTLKAREERRLLRGHLWVYRNELAQMPTLEDGTLVDVFSAERRFVGRGFYQREGGIAARLLSRHQEEIDANFWRARLDAARVWREQLFPNAQSYRWIFGESDGFPGLVVDRYGAAVVVRAAAAFYDAHAETLAGLMLEQPGVEGVLFDLPHETQRHGALPERYTVQLEGLEFEIDASQTQKTGLFLDQRLNSAHIAGFCKDARVFDGHCYHGQWALHAARGGAASVLGVDSSAAAIAQAEANAARNGYAARCTFRCAQVEEVLAEEEEPFDVILLDPPAFAKSRGQAKKALGRYQALNALAMQKVRPGGLLVSSSCSHFIDRDSFLETIKRAAASARRTVWLCEFRGAAPDHPVLLAMPETAYLKCAFLRIL